MYRNCLTGGAVLPSSPLPERKTPSHSRITWVETLGCFHFFWAWKRNMYFSLIKNFWSHNSTRRSQRPRGLRRRSADAQLLRFGVRIPLRVWMLFCCECCVLSGKGLCDEMITRPEESYRLRCVVVCDLETSWTRRPWPTEDCRAKNKRTNNNSTNTHTHTHTHTHTQTHTL